MTLWPELNYLTMNTERCPSRGSSNITVVPEPLLYYSEVSWPLVMNLWHKRIFSRQRMAKVSISFLVLV